MQAWHYGLASPPTEYIPPSARDFSPAGDSNPGCLSSATQASTASSLSTLASAASTSMWSAPSSQNSESTPTSVSACESDSCSESQNASQQKRFVTGKLFGESLRPEFGLQRQQQHQTQHDCLARGDILPPELRKNPRRTSTASSASRGCPPTLFRQVDRKVEFVDKLVDSATYIVEAIWPTSSAPCRADFGASASGLPLRKFIEETLRRSRTSYSTLQVGLYYLILIKPHIPAHDFTMEQTEESHASRVLQCGRRMFLAALILASKWLQDRNYSARAWSKISGLKISEINENEIAFLTAVNWKLHVTEEMYNLWSDCVMKHTPSLPPSSGGSGARARCFDHECAAFKKLIRGLTPELDNVDDLVPVPSRERQPLPLTLTGVWKPSPTLHPSIIEPQPAAVCSPGRQVPALGLLPNPRRLLSQPSSGLSTPAASAVSQLLGRTCSMSSAMSHAKAVSAAQTADRWTVPTDRSLTKTPPQSYTPTRRSSLANTVSTASSPESMVSDSSGNSRTSSVSSASLLHNAPAYMQARRAVGERQRMIWNGQQFAASSGKRSVGLADVVDPAEPYLLGDGAPRTASPESYGSYHVDDLCDPSSKPGLPELHLSVRDAAFALQELHNHRDVNEQTPRPTEPWAAAAAAPSRQASKRKRVQPQEEPDSVLQENVRDLLDGNVGWSDRLMGPTTTTTSHHLPLRHHHSAWLPRVAFDGTVEADVDGSPCKRSRLSPPDVAAYHQPSHLKEAYGQHRLIPSM